MRLWSNRKRRLAVLALSTVVGLLAAGLNAGEQRVAAASTQVFIDTSPPSVMHRAAYPVAALIRRAEMLREVVTSPPVLARIAREARLSADEIGTGGRVTVNVPLALTEPASERRASDIANAGLPYHIEVQARQESPILDIYARAPTTAEAERLANAAVTALDAYVGELADLQQVPQADRLRLSQLGTARGSDVNGGLPIAIAVVTFLVAFGLTCGGSLLWLRRRSGAPLGRPQRAEHTPGDDWPRTTRLLPWSVAGFIAVLWLIPFNEIELTVQLPIDLKFDRLVLPFVAATWAIGLLVGGRLAPRLRMTWIHVGVGAFVACAFLSVVFNARYLNRTLELEGALKQLPLLIAYVSLFVIAATAIRASEVRAFLTYTLVLASVCAFGVIWEYRFKQNIFYDWSGKLLPSIFDVGALDTAAVDNIGRRMVRGPAALPLEAVAMLAMALPIGLVSVMQSTTWRNRVLYGLAVCLLLAAAFATYRKSALLAPISVIATMAYFRRRELLRLAPLGFVLIIVVHIAAPGALGKTTTQFDPTQLGVTTVSDRAADYDAVRPDLWSHLLFGRGWGSYDHATYRTLDSELLHRVLEVGVFGLLAYVFMIASVVLSARATIASRDRTWAPFALMGAAAAISFLVVSTLFDVLAFPHATYIFMFMAGLVAVVVRQSGDRGEAPPILHPVELERPPRVLEPVAR